MISLFPDSAVRRYWLIIRWEWCRRMLLLLLLIGCSGAAGVLPAQESAIRQMTQAGISVRAALMEPFVDRQQRQSESISKLILGTQVHGCQTTITDVRLKVVPDPERIHLQIIITGNVSSETRGLNPQAVVHSLGSHWFRIIKPVVFDGRQLLTQPGHGTIRAQQIPLRAVSPVSGVPLIGALADQMTMQEVLRRTPLIDQAVAEDLSRDILPRIDRETDRGLASLEVELRRLSQASERLLAIPAADWSAASQNDLAYLWTGTSMSALLEQAKNEDLVVVIHEDFINRLLRQAVPAGLVLSDNQLNKLLPVDQPEEFSWFNGLNRLIGSPDGVRRMLSAEPEEGSLFSIRLAPRGAVQVRFRDGAVWVQTTFQILPQAGADSGYYSTRVAFRGVSMDDEHWAIVSSDLSVEPRPELDDEAAADQNSAPVEAADSVLPLRIFSLPSADSVWATVLQTTTQALLDRLPTPRLPRTLNSAELDARLPVLRLHRVQARQGTLRISWSRVLTVP